MAVAEHGHAGFDFGQAFFRRRKVDTAGKKKCRKRLDVPSAKPTMREELRKSRLSIRMNQPPCRIGLRTFHKLILIGTVSTQGERHADF